MKNIISLFSQSHVSYVLKRYLAGDNGCKYITDIRLISLGLSEIPPGNGDDFGENMFFQRYKCKAF